MSRNRADLIDKSVKKETYLIGHDDESNVGRAAFVESYRIGYVESHLAVPFTDFGQILSLELE